MLTASSLQFLQGGPPAHTWFSFCMAPVLEGAIESGKKYSSHKKVNVTERAMHRESGTHEGQRFSHLKMAKAQTKTGSFQPASVGGGIV